MTAIRLEGLAKRFGRTVAVDAIDLEVRDGELFFLLGPSGCGKTTLLRMIAGFAEPTSGRILFGERDVTRLAANRRRTGMVFQSYALWPHMSVEENVAYGLRVQKVPIAERRDRVRAALDAVHIRELADRRPTQLSGGQQQRVALARALVIRPTVLLLDEPLSNLDAKLRLEMRREIRRICAESCITTVYVTHDQKEALSMADRIAVLREGRLAQIGTPSDLYDRPTSRFVADFLGETNILPATVESTIDGAVVLQTPGGRLLSTAGMAESPTGGNVTCSIRPEAVRICPQQPGNNFLAGVQKDWIFLGETAQRLIELSDGTILKSLELHPKSRPDEHGEHVYASIDADDVVILSD